MTSAASALAGALGQDVRGVLGAALARVPADVPVTPDAEEARRQAVEELGRPEYHEQASLLARLLQWVQEQLGKIGDSVTVSPSVAWVVVVVVAVAVVAVALWVAGPVRRSRRGPDVAAVRDADDVRTAAQLRAAADAAARAGDWSLAVVERFRAVARSLEERAVLDVRPGRTADEVAADAAPAFPALGDDLVAGARLFDDVAYGDRAAAADDDARLRALDDALVGARPQHGGRALDLTAAVPR